MKTIYTLSTVALIALSLISLADDKIKNKGRSSAVSVAPFSWGDPEAAAPAELSHISIANTSVPLAPFVWGSPEDAVNITTTGNLLVPVAPFIYGDPDADVPEDPESLKTVNLKVPIAPFVLGDPDADASVGI
jgi:hypothetical protein